MKLQVQYNENKTDFVPGDNIRGDLLITATKPVKIPLLDINIEGTLTFIDDSDFPINCEENLHPISDEITCDGKFDIPGDMPNGHTHGQFEHHHHHPATHISNNSNAAKSRTRQSVRLLKTEYVSLIHHSVELNPGITTFPFIISLPSKNKEGQELIPSFSIPSKIISMHYTINVYTKVPLPVFKAFSYPYTTREPINVLQPHLGNQDQSKTQVTAVDNVSVGFWSKKSTDFTQLAKYMIGCDTSDYRTNVVLSASLPSAISITNGIFYLQDVLKLQVSVEGDSSILVNSIQMDVQTRVMAHHTTVEYTYRIFPYSYGWKIAVKGSSDITSLISGTKLSDAIPPSVYSHDVMISNKLLVSVGLSSVSKDGTKQVGSTAKVGVPLNITRNRADKLLIEEPLVHLS